MAFRIKNLGVRALSSAVFVVLLMGSILWSYHSFTLFFIIVGLVGLHEIYGLASHTGAKPYRLLGLISGAALYLCHIDWNVFGVSRDINPDASLCIAISCSIILAVGMFDKSQDAFRNAFLTIAGMIYVILPLSLLHQLVIVRWAGAQYHPNLLVAMILLIWSNDTFAYLWGSLLGKHKLFERVSPGKTWEGTILGALTTFGAAFVIRSWEGYSKDWFLPLLGIVVPIAATIGDLAESYLKRLAGVKDSGNIMPGHGGVLDRFDSLLFVSPVVLLLIKIMVQA